ncbi:LLM class flavin-dependent oxidoreductase [Nostoc sp.]
MSNRTLHFGLNALPAGNHSGAWRSPQASPFGYYDFNEWKHIAKVAERGTLDAIFLADSPSLFTPPESGPAIGFDPTVLLAALASVTEHIGLIGTASTSFEEPYNIARRFGSLDHLSHGRVGWNVVTTRNANAAKNYSEAPHLPKPLRYERAAEFVEVVRKLWDSWDDDALIGDRLSGRFADPQRIYAINHHGKHFHIDGPLNLPRSPQGQPILFQAGGSPGGLELAARYADGVFASLLSFPDAIEFTKDLRRRTVKHGRPADAIKVLPGLSTVIGSTEEETKKRHREHLELTGTEERLAALAGHLGSVVYELNPDQLFPDFILDGTYKPPDGVGGFSNAMIGLARREQLTVSELAKRFSKGHRFIAGTPEQIADSIEEWFLAGAVDGFNLMPDVLPSGLEIFVDYVVPILRKRGIFRHEYTGKTLRDRFGLNRPESVFKREKLKI